MEEEIKKRKIVSSRHLATEGGWQLSEVEFGLIVAFNGFSRWVSRCMSASGNNNLSVLEILVLHNINHRSRKKRLTDVCFMLNIEDSHTVNYALKKLMKQGLVTSAKSGKEMMYGISKKGSDLCDAYRDTREQCLIEGLSSGNSSEDLSEIAATLRSLSGLYDQAARAATSL